MSPPFDLIEAKLAAPCIRPGTVPRTALVERLRAPGSSLTTIIAPAGYGKTTLLALWAAGDPRPFAWVSVDERDNDPVVLLTYVAAALNRIEPLDASVLDAIGGPQDAIWSRAVPRLGAALSSASRPLVVAIDDVHALQAGNSLDALASLAGHVPEGSQLVLAARATPELPLARLRARGRLREIGPDALALELGEAQELLREAGLELSGSKAGELHAQTEGWAAGLYLAALSRTSGSRGSEESGAFRGDDRFVAEYLWQEHLSRLPPKQLRFLTRTAVLERLCAPLCDALLGRHDSARMLERLERSNLFLVSLDHHREWYRYHHLFRDVLRAELERREPELVADLYATAADWCEANGRPEWAIDYAAAAGDIARLGGLTARYALPFFRAGRVATVEAWLGRFDDLALLEPHPMLVWRGALLHAVRGRPVEAERWLEALELSKHEGPLPDGSASVRPWIALCRAMLCQHGIGRMRSDAQAAVDELAVESDARSQALLLLGISDLLGGDDERADVTLAEAAETAAVRGAVHGQRAALAERALIAASRGDNAEAEAFVTEAQALGRERFDDYTPTALVLAASSRVALGQGQPTRARDLLVKAHGLRPQLTYAIPWLAVQVRLELAGIHLALSDVGGARELLREIDDVLRVRPGLGVLVGRVEALREQLTALRVQPAAGWASTLTTAELRLLPLLATHLTFREIGERLNVSRNTVKTQAISIYRKLGAASRSQAIEQAAELGLLDASISSRSRQVVSVR